MKLTPGVQVTFYATATDYRPQSGKSDSRRLVVITPEQLIERIGQQQRFLLAELGRALEMERARAVTRRPGLRSAWASWAASTSLTSTTCKGPIWRSARLPGC